MTIDQQVALDKALVPHASRLRIGKSNFHLRSDITSNESTLQLVYDVLRLTPFYKAFMVTAYVPEIYMQEFWATATVHHHSIRFKMDSKKQEIVVFLRFLRHSGEIRKLNDAQILLGMYHKKNVDFAYLLWEDFVYQVKHKDAKKSNEMYYPRFTKVIIHYFMTKDPSIPRRNKVNWHYVRDDQMFTTIKLVLRHQNTQQFGIMLPVELTNKHIRNSEAYKEYYAIASGAVPPKTKASFRKTKSSFDTTITPLTVTGTRLSTSVTDKQPAKSSKAKGLTVLSEVALIEAKQINDEDDDDDEIDKRSDDQEDDDDQDDDDDDQDDDDQDDNDDDQDNNNDGDDFVHPKLSILKEEAKDEEIFDPIVQTPENSDDEGNEDASIGLNVSGEERQDAEDDDEELYRDSSSMSSQFVTSMLNPSPDACIDSLCETTPRVDVQASTTVSPLTLTAPTLPPPTISTISQEPQAPTPPTTNPSTFLNLYKALVDAYEYDKIILDTYGDTVTLKRRRDDADKDEEPSAGSNRGSKRRREGKEPESTSAPKAKATKTTGKSTQGSRSHQRTASEFVPAKEPMQITQDLEEPSHQEFETCAADDQPIKEASQHPIWFQQQKKPPTPDRAWNKTLSATHGSIQPWISDLGKQADSRSSFNELMDAHVDFSTILMN
nr:hypothetical protein [Tanacetum cinerariifolium]GEZ06634.1 hypothetical protein [Tanacetum cinerariifolium]